MELSTQHLYGPIEELEALSPTEWALVDAGHARENPDDKSGGVFRFEVTARPSSPGYDKYRKKLVKRAAPVFAAMRIENEKSLARFIVKDSEKTPAQIQAETQASYDAACSLLVSLVQVFNDGDRAPVEGDELVSFFVAPIKGQNTDWCEAAAAGLEDELEPEQYKALEKKGESLAAAVARLIESTAKEAELQRAKSDQEEVAGPLSSQNVSGLGSEEGKTPTLSAVAS